MAFEVFYTDSSACDPNKFSDEIKYLREENNTNNCDIQALLENQKKCSEYA